jgi:hypothetical protein
VYYRWFRFPDGRTLWTLSLSPLILSLAAVLLPALIAVGPGAFRLTNSIVRRLSVS